ncbi:MAG: YodL domain-containing protein [Ruminococcus sp.]
MDINQFAVYQLKNGPETRQMRFRSYEKLQQSGIQVRYEYYREVYLGKIAAAGYSRKHKRTPAKENTEKLRRSFPQCQ